MTNQTPPRSRADAIALANVWRPDNSETGVTTITRGALRTLCDAVLSAPDSDGAALRDLMIRMTKMSVPASQIHPSHYAVDMGWLANEVDRIRELAARQDTSPCPTTRSSTVSAATKMSQSPSPTMHQPTTSTSEPAPNSGQSAPNASTSASPTTILEELEQLRVRCCEVMRKSERQRNEIRKLLSAKESLRRQLKKERAARQDTPSCTTSNDSAVSSSDSMNPTNTPTIPSTASIAASPSATEPAREPDGDEIEAWKASATTDPCKPPFHREDDPYPIGYWLAASEIDQALAIMRRLRDRADAAERDAGRWKKAALEMQSQRNAALAAKPAPTSERVDTLGHQLHERIDQWCSGALNPGLHAVVDELCELASNPLLVRVAEPAGDGALRRSVEAIEERTRPDRDMADVAVNEALRAALAASNANARGGE